jgi:voltage-gated potassium channel Kch
VKDIVVIGGGGHGRVVISLIRKLAALRLLGYTDTNPGGPVLGAPCLGGDEVLEQILRDRPDCNAALGVGTVSVSPRRLEIAANLQRMGFELPALVSPAAIVNEDVTLGAGTIICDGAVLAAGARVGIGCILNTGCVIVRWRAGRGVVHGRCRCGRHPGAQAGGSLSHCRRRHGHA